MALRKIFQDGDEILTKHCREVTSFDEKLGILIDDMWETMYDAEGVGLAAPQVGILRRVVVIDTGEEAFALVNPQIVSTEGVQIGEEGCLSVDSSKNCMVARPNKLTVRAVDKEGKPCEYTVEGLAARAVCHELDHLDGILFYTKKYEGKK